MPRKKKKQRGMTGGQKLSLSIFSVLAVLIAVAVISLSSSGDLYYVLGCPPPDAPSRPVQNEACEVYYLDIGQGDSELIRISEEDGGTFTVLIDAGDNGQEAALLGELKDIGVNRIDAAVFTHPHADHIGGAAEVIRTVDVGSVYLPPVPDRMTPTTVTYEAMLDAMAEKHLRYTEATAGMLLYDSPNITLEVLSPERKDTWDNLNDWSVVLRLDFYEHSFLFTGDAEAPCEQALLKKGSGIRSDVLKLGHHGSDTSTTEAFLDAVSPQYAIISCGRNNTYGHPHREILQRLKAHGVPYFRTDENGTVLARSDGQNLKIAPLDAWGS